MSEELFLISDVSLRLGVPPHRVAVAWTTDPWVAQVICKLLTDNEELLG